MKRTITIALIVLMAATGFAQTTGLESVQSDTSFGVFGNELDAALTVQEAGNRPVFSDLTNQMIFGGLSNLNYEGAVENDGLFIATALDPLWIGYFGPGDTPFSLFLGMFYDGTTTNAASDTVNTTTPKNGIVSGTTTTNYDWISTTVTTEYTGNRIYDLFEKHAQVIMPLGGMNVGLGTMLWLQDGSTQANNYELTRTEYYDTAIGTEAPSPAVDYTYTATETDLAKDTYIELTVPVFLRTGDIGHTVQIGGAFFGQNYSDSFTESYTDPADGGLGPITVRETDDTTSKASSVFVNAMYEATMPAFFGENDNNEFSFGAAVDTDLRNAEYSETLLEQDKTWAGAGATATLGELNNDTFTATFEGQSDLGFDLMASHSFYFDLGEAVRFGLIPDVMTGIEVDKDDFVIVSDVDVDRQDNDADGAFTSAADRVITTTTTYTNTSVDPIALTTGDVTNDFVISTEFGMAGAIEFTPGNWPFSVTLGSRPRLVMTNTQTTTLTAQTATTTTTVDGTGADLGTVVNQAPASDEESVWTHGFTVDAEHRIGLNMLLGENVRLDAALNLGTGVSILDFRNLVVQAIVELP